MKYIIDIPDEYVNYSSSHEATLTIPMKTFATDQKFYIPTQIGLEPYEELNKKGFKVGDVVEYTEMDRETMKVVILDKLDEDGNFVVFTKNGCAEVHNSKNFVKTNEHFDEIDNILKKMRKWD